MLNFVLPLLKNPLTRIVAEKTVGAIQHKLEKDKIIKAGNMIRISKNSINHLKGTSSDYFY